MKTWGKGYFPCAKNISCFAYLGWKERMDFAKENNDVKGFKFPAL